MNHTEGAGPTAVGGSVEAGVDVAIQEPPVFQSAYLHPAHETEILRAQGVLGAEGGTDELSGLVAAVAVACALVLLVKLAVGLVLWFGRTVGRGGGGRPSPVQPRVEPRIAGVHPRLRGGGA